MRAVSTFQIALLLHLLGAILYAAGIIVAGLAFFSARRRSRPSEIAAVLSIARSGVLVAGAGSAIVLGFGLWLVQLGGFGYGDAWISAALVLFVAAGLVGGLAGQAPKKARRLAGELALAEDAPSPELDRLLGDRPSLALNLLAALMTLAILVLMVWRPGS
jgi:uncharacterized membrane protein